MRPSCANPVLPAGMFSPVESLALGLFLLALLWSIHCLGYRLFINERQPGSFAADLRHGLLLVASFVATVFCFGLVVAAFAPHFVTRQMAERILRSTEPHFVLAASQRPGERSLLDPQLISVLYVSNRVVDFATSPPLFSSKRSPNLTFGFAEVRVPENHKLGAVERPRRLVVWGITVRRDGERDADHFI